MWLELPSTDLWIGTFLWVCECGSLEIDWFCCGRVDLDQLTLAAVCRSCLRTGTINLPKCGHQFMGDQ